MNQTVLTVFFVINLVWLAILTYLIVKVNSFFLTLAKDLKKGNLNKILEQVVKAELKNSTEINNLRRNLTSLTEEVELHVQKMSLVKFNPFGEVGGKHSFSLVLLDAKNKGIVLTGLHTRERTRVYIKEIKNGRSKQELSKEEKKALKSALSK